MYVWNEKDILRHSGIPKKQFIHILSIIKEKGSLYLILLFHLFQVFTIIRILEVCTYSTRI